MQDNLLLFYGKNDFLLKEKLKRWEQLFQQKHNGDLNFQIIDGAKEETGMLIQSLETMPFLDTKRLVFIEGFLQRKKDQPEEELLQGEKNLQIKEEKIADFLPQLPSSTVVVFVAGKVSERSKLFKRIKELGKVEEFKELSFLETKKWLKQKSGTVLNERALEYLLERVGADPWQLNQEIDKLTTYTKGQPITEREIDCLVRPNFDTTVFQFLDSLKNKNLKQTFRVFRELTLTGEPLEAIFTMLIRNFRILLQVKTLSQQKKTMSAIIATLALKPFVVQKALEAEKKSNFSLRQLKQIYAKLLKIDVGIKTGQFVATGGMTTSELQLQLEKFLVGLTMIEKGDGVIK